MAEIEGRETGSGMYRVIVGELQKRQMTHPVLAMVGGKLQEDGLERAVGAFSLAIRLRVVGSGHVQFGSKNAGKS